MNSNEKKQNIIHLRPHHLLCMLGFRGYGYNERFISNMSQIVHHLQKNPDSLISISIKCDDICIACPHNKNAICSEKPNANENVQRLDKNVKDILQIPLKVPISIREAQNHISEYLTIKTMSILCQNCDWWKFGYCAAGLEKLLN